MVAAVKGMSLSTAGRVREAIQLITATQADDPNPYLTFFRALLEKRNGQDEAALTDFAESLAGEHETQVSKAFGFSEDEPLHQLIRLSISMRQPRAALKLAERDSELKSASGPAATSSSEETGPAVEADESHDGSAYRTLQTRFEEHRASARVELLEMLSEAAEGEKEFSEAADFEIRRLAMLRVPEERSAAESRLNRLLDLQREESHGRAPELTIDQRFIAER